MDPFLKGGDSRCLVSRGTPGIPVRKVDDVASSRLGSRWLNVRSHGWCWGTFWFLHSFACGLVVGLSNHLTAKVVFCLPTSTKQCGVAFFFPVDELYDNYPTANYQQTPFVLVLC